MKKLKLIFWVIGILLVGGRRNLAAFFAFTNGVSRRLRQSSDKWQKVAKKLTFGAVLLNNLTKNHAACRKHNAKRKNPDGQILFATFAKWENCTTRDSTRAKRSVREHRRPQGEKRRATP